MQAVSYIIEAATVTSKQMRSLSDIATQARRKGIQSEYIIYPGVNDAQLPYVSVVQSNYPNVTSFEKAVASASGNQIVITTLSNSLADKDSAVALQASQQKDYSLVAPSVSRPSFLDKYIVRRIRSIQYLIVSKRFAGMHCSSITKYSSFVRLADKQLSLKLVEPAIKTLPDFLTADMIILRPYFTIIERRYQEKKQTIKDRRKRRKDEYLSRRVPEVVYSPDIPVFIICRDRVEPLKKLVTWCEDEGLTNIIFVDNDSTYKPLLDYYSKTPHELIRLRTNIGHTSPWSSGAIGIYAKDRPFIVTDPDVLPMEDSHGAVKRFCELLTKYPIRRKVGFGLKIDDLPDHYDLKKNVVEWEKQFWVSQVEDEVFDAEIDTTFALYRQRTPYILGPGLRTGEPFTARHEPWYIDSNSVSDEMTYYRDHADKDVGTWGVNSSDINDVYL